MCCGIRDKVIELACHLLYHRPTLFCGPIKPDINVATNFDNYQFLMVYWIIVTSWSFCKVSELIFLQLSSGKYKLQLKSRVPSKKLQHPYALAARQDYPQNADLPRQYSKREKKPFPIPIVELRRAARARAKNRSGQPRRPVPPPKRGLLVKNLIPVAYDVLNARITLINNLKKLWKVVPVHACV